MISVFRSSLHPLTGMKVHDLFHDWPLRFWRSIPAGAAQILPVPADVGYYTMVSAALDAFVALSLRGPVAAIWPSLVGTRWGRRQLNEDNFPRPLAGVERAFSMIGRR